MEGGSSESLLEKEELKERVKLLTEKIGSLEGEREKMTVKLHHAQETILELQKGVSEGVKGDLAKNEVIAERTVQVTNEEQRIIWEGYGLRLFIPPNSLPDDCSQFTLKIAVSRAKDFVFPAERDGILVSAVYEFHDDLGDRKLRQPVTLEMQHFVSNNSYSSLAIVHCDNILEPHKFHTLQGRFDSCDGYGAVEVNRFCCFFIYMQLFLDYLIPTVRFRKVLYYTNIKPRSFHFHLYIVPETDAIIQVCFTHFLFVNI